MGTTAGEAMDFARIDKMRPYQLKAECRKRGLDADGDRDTLIMRLKGASDGSTGNSGSSPNAPTDSSTTTGLPDTAWDATSSPFERNGDAEQTGRGEAHEADGSQTLTTLAKGRARVRAAVQWLFSLSSVPIDSNSAGLDRRCSP